MVHHIGCKLRLMLLLLQSGSLLPGATSDHSIHTALEKNNSNDWAAWLETATASSYAQKHSHSYNHLAKTCSYPTPGSQYNFSVTWWSGVVLRVGLGAESCLESCMMICV